jgi:hypothetical protein
VTETGLVPKTTRTRDLRVPRRKLTVEWDNSDLAADIDAFGQREPIVVWHGDVIDGVRRMRVLRRREVAGRRREKFHDGWVDAVFPKTVDELISAMPRWTDKGKHGKAWAERPFDAMTLWYAVRESVAAERKERGGSPIAFRENLRKHLQVTVQYANTLLAAYSKFADMPPMATQYLQDKLEAAKRGEISPAYLIDLYYKYRMNGDLLTAAQQRLALDRILASLNGINASFTTLGPLAPDLTDEEMATWIKGLEQARSNLHLAIDRVRKGRQAQ